MFLYITQILIVIFLSSYFLLWNNFSYLVLCTVIFHRPGLNTFYNVIIWNILIQNASNLGDEFDINSNLSLR